MKSSGDWFPLYDNAPAHNATVARQFLASRNLIMLHHSSYSPDIAPSNFFFVLKLKLKLKGNRWHNGKQIQTNITTRVKNESRRESRRESLQGCFFYAGRERKSIPIQDFQNALNRLIDRAKRCMELREM